jgi:hypothetical protein
MPVDILYRQLWMIRQLSGPVYVFPDQIQLLGSEWICISREICQLSMYQSKNRSDYGKYKKYKVQSSMTSLGFRLAAGPSFTPPVRAAVCLLHHLNGAIEAACSNSFSATKSTSLSSLGSGHHFHSNPQISAPQSGNSSVTSIKQNCSVSRYGILISIYQAMSASRKLSVRKKGVSFAIAGTV